ncbi:MAG: type II secretion system GspH family protein [Deltaproteobacteria bacterium]|nr:type II secretion system GspH family protein [Deltaproteobacteria bacterium]
MRGFSLVELLIVMTILAILGLLSVNSFSRAKHIAAFSTSQATLRQVETALELGIVHTLETVGDIDFPLTQITSQDQITNSNILSNILWGFTLPQNTTLTFAVNTSCFSSNCTQAVIGVDHTSACKTIQKTQFGDGAEVVISLPKNAPGC